MAQQRRVEHNLTPAQEGAGVNLEAARRPGEQPAARGAQPGGEPQPDGLAAQLGRAPEKRLEQHGGYFLAGAEEGAADGAHGPGFDSGPTTSSCTPIASSLTTMVFWVVVYHS